MHYLCVKLVIPSLVLFWAVLFIRLQLIFMKSTGFDLKSEKDPLKYQSGPPIAFGGYEKYNWCKRCKTIHTKDIKFCPTCRMQMRTTSKNKFGGRRNSRNLYAKEKRERRIKVLEDLNEWQMAKALNTQP